MKRNSISSSNGSIKKSSKPSTTKRIPRPNGATALAVEARLTNKPETYISFMVNHWLVSNGKVCGRTLSMNQMANSLRISPEFIRTTMRDNLLSSKIFDREHQEQIAMGLVGELLTWTMEDRMRINSQIEILSKAQKDTYTPFVSAEVNKSLKLGLESSTALQGVLNRLTGSGGTTNIFNLSQEVNKHEVTNNYVTTTQVLEIISEEQKELDKPQLAKRLEATYDLTVLPEVVATKQEGIDTSKEGLGGNIDVTLLNATTDNMKAALEVAEEDHHSMRREIEERIDPDEEDPELEIYEDYEEVTDTFSVKKFLNHE